MPSTWVKLASRFFALLVGMTLAAPPNTTRAAEPYRVLSPIGDAPHPAVLLVPGCSGFVARNGINLYDERAAELQAGGYLVVFVDYLGRRNLRGCGGGRDVSHAEVAKDILDASVWTREQAVVASEKISVIAWSYGGGGVLAALTAMPPGPPVLTKAVLYYPDCRRAKPWSSTGVSILVGASVRKSRRLLPVRITALGETWKAQTSISGFGRHGFWKARAQLEALMSDG